MFVCLVVFPIFAQTLLESNLSLLIAKSQQKSLAMLGQTRSYQARSYSVKPDLAAPYILTLGKVKAMSG